MKRAGWAAVTFLLAVAGSSSARAAPLAPERRPTDGVDRPIHDYSAEGDASSLELNPALLSAVGGLDLTLRGYQSTYDYGRGNGFGGFFAANFGFGVALGFGVQSMQPAFRDAFDVDAALNPALTKLSFGMSVGSGELGSAGVTVHGIRAAGHWLRSPDVDIGTMFRVFNYGSVGIMARLSPAPVATSAGLPGHLSMVGEAAVRPLGTHHLELAGGLTALLYRTDDDDALEAMGTAGLLPHARIALRYHGWSLKGEAQQVRVAELDPMGGNEVIRRQKAWRGGVALEAAWDFVSAEGGVHVGLSDAVDGVGFAARITTQRQGRVFWPRSVEAERLEIGSIVDERSFIAMLQRIERARQAGERAVLLVDARGTAGGWARLHELRSALIRVRNAGGHVFAYLEAADLPDYYLASAAETVYIHPAGELRTYGLSWSILYFAEALEKIGVRVEALHIDEYKSAHEPWTQTEPSAADREQRTEILRDTFGLVVHDIAQARTKSLADVRTWLAAAPHTPQSAVEAGMVDAVLHRDELTTKMSSALGANVDFARFAATDPEKPTWSQAPYIAVVVIEGTIVDGESRSLPFLGVRFAGAETITRTLREVRSDPACRGIVVRVDSPGGSALASDVIWREIDLTRQAHRRDPGFNPPIVVSMGDVAGSGGYYVAVGAQRVFADPLSMTGSIGVVSLHFDVSGLLAKLGISRATFQEGDNPPVDGIFAPYSARQRERVRQSMQHTYDLFRERVAKGRNMDADAVHRLGRGRVYSGLDAAALDLVDELGGLHDALAWVRQRAGVGRWRDLELRVLPRQPTLLDLILDVVGAPLDDRGPVVTRIRARGKRREALPLALDAALARLPLGLLLLPQGQAHTILPGALRID